MKRYWYLTTMLVGVTAYAGAASAQDCVQSQDCASLGYTETSCTSGGVKCPFGDKWACYPDVEKSVNCEVGTLYYSDGTCSDKLESSKTLLGVVIYADGAGGGWIMTVNPIVKMLWSVEHVDIPELVNVTEESDLTDIQASCENTDIMTKQGDSSNYWAAWTAKNYKPNGTPSGKNWCLPSGGLLKEAFKNLSNIEKVSVAINTAGGVILGKTYRNGAGEYLEEIWSSTEFDYEDAWYFSIGLDKYLNYQDSWLTYGDKVSSSQSTSKTIRPVMCFGENCDDSRTANGAQGDLYYCNGKVVGVKTPNMDFYVALKDFSSDYWKNAYNTIKYNMFCEDTLAYMPTKDDLVKIYNNKNSLDDLFEKYGGKKLSSGYYWSETDSGDSSYRYVLNMSNGSVVSYHVNTTPHFVRIVLKP